jgi:hypothetical protein
MRGIVSLLTVHRNFWNRLLNGIALLGIAPLAIGLVVRLVFLSQNFDLSRVLSLENVGLLFGMVFLALAVFWVLDTIGQIFLAFPVLSLISIVILAPCTYTGEYSHPFGMPISISLVSIAVLIFYIALFMFLHFVWLWAFEYVTASVLLFAAIFTENMALSLFAFSFALVIVMTIKQYSKMGHYSNVVIYRFGKPVRKRIGTFLIIPFIEEFRPEFEEPRPEDRRG